MQSVDFAPGRRCASGFNLRSAVNVLRRKIAEP